MDQETRRKTQQRQEEKLWSEIAAPITLSDALDRLTKAQLTEIARNLNIKRVSALPKKELTLKLSETVPDAIESVLLLFDQKRYDTVKAAVSKGGHIVYRKLEYEQVEYFCERGLLFPGTLHGIRSLVMPLEIMEAFKRIHSSALTSAVKKNTERIRLALGMLQYYGTLSFDQIENLLSKYTGENIDFMECFELFLEAEDYYGAPRFNRYGYSTSRVFDGERVIEEHEMRPTLDFFPFSKEQLLRAGEPDFVDRNSSYKALTKFLYEKFDIPMKVADSLVEECVYAVNLDESLPDILMFLESQLEVDSLEDLQSLTDKLVELMNNTRQWFLKGWTPQELSSTRRENLRPLPRGKADVISLQTRKKVGRNDPCPCGSGKKFKKCCGS